MSPAARHHAGSHQSVPLFPEVLRATERLPAPARELTARCFGAGGGDIAAVASVGTARLTSVATVSSLSPSHVTCRRSPSAVHVRYRTWHTNFGRTQCTRARFNGKPNRLLVGGGMPRGMVRVSSGFSLS